MAVSPLALTPIPTYFPAPLPVASQIGSPVWSAAPAGPCDRSRQSMFVSFSIALSLPCKHGRAFCISNAFRPLSRHSVRRRIPPPPPSPTAIHARELAAGASPARFEDEASETRDLTNALCRCFSPPDSRPVTPQDRSRGLFGVSGAERVGSGGPKPPSGGRPARPSSAFP